MRPWQTVFSATVVAGALLGGSALATAQAQSSRSDDDRSAHAVFVQGNDPTGNQVLAYRRAANGTLSLVARYPTGGNGGRVQGSVVDPLASQGSLVYDEDHRLLIGVNAGSNSIYALRVEGDQLQQRQVLGSGGTLPVSVAVHENLVYVLNAGGHGSVYGYRIEGGRLHAIDGSARSLGLTPATGDTAFLNTPGQVGFTPDGDQLIVTTKANGSNIDVFSVRRNGQLSDAPVKNPSATPVPFAFTFEGKERLVVGEAGTASVTTYQLHDNGRLTEIASQTDGQAALCWIDQDGQNYIGSNAGSDNLSVFRVDARGRPSLSGTTPVGPGPIDLAHAGQFLYVELGGNGRLAELRVGDRDGSLTPLGTVPTSANQEGIVAL